MGEARRRADAGENDAQIEAERLRQLRAVVEDALREFDVCAHVTLAGRHGRFENFTHVDATWSGLRWKTHPAGPALHLRSKLADYAGDVARQKRELEWSVGVVSGLGRLMAQTAIALLRVAEHFDKATGAEHWDGPDDDPRRL